MGLHNLSGCGANHSIGLGPRESGNRCLKPARLHRTGIVPILAVLVPARGQTMVINGSRNKPFGPGGSTRRLHQSRLLAIGDRPASRLISISFRAPAVLSKTALMGAKQDRRGCKGGFFARDDTDVIGSFLVANDNFAPVALAA